MRRIFIKLILLGLLTVGLVAAENNYYDLYFQVTESTGWQPEGEELVSVWKFQQRYDYESTCIADGVALAKEKNLPAWKCVAVRKGYVEVKIPNYETGE